MTTPKERFLASSHAAAFTKLVASESFEAACDYAFLQFCDGLPVNCQPGSETDALLGLDANAQRVGASRVLEILKHLAEPIKPPSTPTTPKLHY